MSKRMLVAALGLLAVAGVAPASAAEFSISFRWCGGSPETTLANVPKAAKSLVAELVDLQVPSYDHGGGTVAYAGQKTLRCGTFPRYRSPGPPPPQVHTYQWTVRALGADGREIARATATRRFPEK